MSRTIRAEPLTAKAFAPFGAVLEATGTPDFMINAGLCGRHHDLARPETDVDGAVSLSVGRSEAVTLPLSLGMMERHPHGSQAFVPMGGARFLVIVAEDQNGTPSIPHAFLTNGRQGIQYKMNCWHGVLAPLTGPSDFLIVDRVGPGDNLEEHHLTTPYIISKD
ncbi:ureidoglycolate lyase [Nisaea sp.]|uniref:ureidoglycolate lyase n=1 Tax=Nisaea sp. TaxID=2024842 RepID=UPI002B275665|nr:ureidoglycolate lyase [Nisaea sp.]